MDGGVEDTLEEMLKWLKFMGRQEARNVVANALSYEDEEKEKAAKITYQLITGENSTKDIEKYIPFSYKWVSTRHQEWATQGIVEKTGGQGFYQHLLTLDELGIDYPKIAEDANG